MLFETKRLGPVGVELLGVDLCGEIADELIAELRRTVMDVGLVLLRDQPIEPERHVALGQRFGSIEQLDASREGLEPSMVVIGNVDREGRVFPDDDPRMKLVSINEGWHTDSTFREIPASFSIFGAVVVPEQGGDTFYASLQNAWDALAPTDQAELYGLNGVHDYNAAYRRRGNEQGGIVGYDEPQRTHPLVREHPETGRKGLFISEHMAGIEGWPEAEGQALVEKLIALATSEDRVYRHHWEVADLAIWDNRSMLHRAQGFDQRFPRRMHHVRVGGDEPPIAATSPPVA
ncbi:MAG: TauD/TfdA dioxygenase family protein [Planctomycetota bacterium]